VNLLAIASAVTEVTPPPPGGLAWGRYPVPAWVLWLVCAVTVLGAVAFLIARAQRASPKRAAPPERR
jgi:hypothetical protein